MNIQTVNPTILELTIKYNPDIKLKSTAELISQFDKCWNERKKCFEDKFNHDEFRHLLFKHNDVFKHNHDLTNCYGVIGKKDLEAETKIFIRADIHGDLKSLLENIKEAQRQGLLDENYKCKPKVQLIFLGDYTDRGSNSLQVIQLLMTLRKENPDQVTLIRGNHEDTDMNIYYCVLDNDFKTFLNDTNMGEINKKLLNEFYDTLFLTMYMGEQDSRQYVQFTHALFEFYVDPSEMLRQKTHTAMMSIPMYTSEIKFSNRINKIKIDDDLIKSKLKLVTNKTDRKKWKLMHAIKKIKQLHKSSHIFRSHLSVTAYNWGDIDKQSFPGDLGRREWKISPEDLKNYLYLCSTLEEENPIKVKMIFRGHEHLKQHHVFKKKVVSTTLPVAMDSLYATKYPNQKDTFYVIDIAPKVKNWTKTIFEREQGSSTTRKGNTTLLQDPKN